MKKKEEEFDKKEFREKLQTLINKEKFCWVCGREDMLTEHHAIPQKINGVKMNVTVPLCRNCHEFIHQDNYFMKLLKKVNGIG